jgi:prophage antirepressor-like protein
MTELTIFAYESSAVRTVRKDGEPWFVATDIAKILGYKEAKDMARMLDDDEKGAHILPTLGGEQELLIISESGLYAAILKSRREEAKKFRKWVTSEVLPSIRKTGGYIDPEVVRAIPKVPAHEADHAVAAARSFNAMMRAGRAMGLPLAQAALRANDSALRRSGVDVMAEMGVSVDDLVIPTEPKPDAPPDPIAEGIAAWAASIDGGLWSMEEIIAQAFGVTPASGKYLRLAVRVGPALSAEGFMRRKYRRDGKKLCNFWERASA